MFVPGCKGVQSTGQVFSFLFSRVFPGVDFPDKQAFLEVSNRAEKVMQKDADALSQSHSMLIDAVDRLTTQHQLEMAQKDKGIAERDTAIAARDTAIEDLESQLREAKRQKS